MGAVCVANKNKNNSTVKDDIIVVKCKITSSLGSFYISYFKSNLSLKEIKIEISKKLKKAVNSFQMKIKGDVIKYEKLQLKYFVKNKLDEIEIVLVENSNMTFPDSHRSILMTKDSKDTNDIKKYNSKNSNASKQLDTIENLSQSFALDEQSINVMSKFCDIHYKFKQPDMNIEEEKDSDKFKITMICQTCGTGICKQCLEETHKDHVTINKLNILEYNNILVENYNVVNEQLNEMNLISEHTDLIKNFKIDIKKHSDVFFKMLEDIKKREDEIIDKFKNQINNSLPFILYYRDNLKRINNNYEKNLNNIISDDKLFMQFYLDYLLLSNQVVKSAENLGSLKTSIKKYNFILQDYQSRTNSILESVKENFLPINSYLTEEFEKEFFSKTFNANNDDNIGVHVIDRANSANLKRSISPSLNQDKHDSNQKQNNTGSNLNLNNKSKSRLSLKDLINLQTRNLSTSYSGSKKYSLGGVSALNNYILDNLSNTDKPDLKINLKSLMETPNKMISGLIKQQKRKKSLINQENYFSEGKVNLDTINEFGVNSLLDQVNPEYICNIEDGSNYIYMFKCQDYSITKQQVKLDNLGITKFEAHHSSLNYKNRFYVSGSGLGSSKSFMFLDIEDDFNMRKLPDMLNQHSFHGMLGVFSSIIVISGTLTNKVEKYDINNKLWSAFPSLNYSRTWPSSAFVENQGIFVFGGLIENTYNRDEEKDLLDNTDKNILKIEKLDIKVMMRYYDSNSNLDNENESNKWEILLLNLVDLHFPVFSGFAFVPDASNDRDKDDGKIFIFGGKSNLDEYESEDKIYSLNLLSLQIKEELFKLEVSDEFDGKSFIKFTKKDNNILDQEQGGEKNSVNTCYAQFSSCVPKRIHIISNEKSQIVECTVQTQSSYKL